MLLLLVLMHVRPEFESGGNETLLSSNAIASRMFSFGKGRQARNKYAFGRAVRLHCQRVVT
jgi:hypothetical protein